MYMYSLFFKNYLQHINDLMDTVMKPAFKTAWLKMKVSFLLSDTWNDDPALLESYGDIMRGSFSFNFNSDFKVSANCAGTFRSRCYFFKINSY